MPASASVDTSLPTPLPEEEGPGSPAGDSGSAAEQTTRSLAYAKAAGLVGSPCRVHAHRVAGPDHCAVQTNRAGEGLLSLAPLSQFDLSSGKTTRST